jgi:hypothetical protein
MQDRQGDSGAALDAMGGKHGPGPSAAALDSMLSNDVCQEHVRGMDTADVSLAKLLDAPPAACKCEKLHSNCETFIQVP